MTDMEKPTDLIDIKIIEVKPTHIGQRCPTCNGWGTLSFGKKICPSCEGKAYILVPVKEISNYTMPAKGGEMR